MNYLPLNDPNEEALLQSQRQEYKALVEYYNSGHIKQQKDRWFQDAIKLVHKDVERTLPEFIIFKSEVIKTSLTRSLIIYSHRFPSHPYCQGFNDIYAHIFLVFAAEQLGLEVQDI